MNPYWKVNCFKEFSVNCITAEMREGKWCATSSNWF